MRKRLDSLQAHYVVCAYGRVGRAAVAELRTEGVPVLVVDRPELAELLEEHGVPHLPADPTEETALQQAGIQRARGLLCAMDSDVQRLHHADRAGAQPRPHDRGQGGQPGLGGQAAAGRRRPRRLPL